MKKTVVILSAFLFAACSPLSADSDRVRSMSASKDNLYKTVTILSELEPARNYRNIDSLNRAADYIKAQLEHYGYTPSEQVYRVDGQKYRNIIATAGRAEGPVIVIGAHYDVCGDQPGADDNATGVAGLLEVARLLKTEKPDLNYRIEMVGYTLEEPPFFRSPLMGSHIHARSLHDSGSKVIAMIGLEMIGFFSDRPKSQDYPLSLMKLFYPATGDFIALVGRLADSSLIQHLKGNMEKTSVKVRTLQAPSFVSGVDFSDHLNYWEFGYTAVMVTDTAFYRNPHYHEATDTLEKLDFDRMSELVKGIYLSVISF